MDSHSAGFHGSHRGEASSTSVPEDDVNELELEGAALDGFPPPAQVAALVSAPAYPNAVKWSDENLLAVSSGHLAYVLNPASLAGPRCFVPVLASPGFDIGKVQSQDILGPSIQGLTLVKDTRPCVRSLAWSPQGFASNGGCLLGVCTTDHRVKLYRSPYFEFQSEWVEVLDVSELIYAHFVNHNFGETEPAASALSLEDVALAPPAPSVKGRKRKLPAEPNKSTKKIKSSKQCAPDIAGQSNKLKPGTLELDNKILSSISEGCKVEILRDTGGSRFWLGGLVLKVVDGKALVRSSDTVEDWFDIHLALHNGDKSFKSTPPIRPQHPTELRLKNGRSLLPSEAEEVRMQTGELVEVWRDHGWQEGILVDAACVPMRVSLSGDTGVVSVEREVMRRPPQWNTSEWVWSQGDQVAVHRECTSGTQTTVGANRGKSYLSNRGSDKKYVTAAQYATRSAELAHLVVAWSPQCTQPARDKLEGMRHFSVFAVGGKSGRVLFFRVPKPLSYSVGKPLPLVGTDYLGSVAAHDSWITALEWVLSPENVRPRCILLLASGSSDGSVKLWISDTQTLGGFCPSSGNSPFRLLKQVMDVDLVPVTTLAVVSPAQIVCKVLLAVGKGSGGLAAFECYTSGEHGEKAYEPRAHEQLVTGLTWTSDGRILYTCGQDNLLRIWELSRNRLWSLAFPSGSSLLATDSSRISEELPASVLESFFGVSLSPGNLALVVLRGVSADMVDQMYQARSQKGVVQLFWIGGQLTQRDRSAYDKPAQDLVQWKSRIVAALNYIEDRESPVVLWDIIAATSLIAQWSSSMEPVESILSSWLLNQGSTADSGLICQWSLETLKEYLPYASCRRLQILNALYRHILLTGIKAEVLSGRSIAHEVLDTHESRNAEQDKDLVDRSSRMQLWKDQLSEVEQELRQRLIFVTLFAAASRRQDVEDDGERTGSKSSLQTTVMAAWASGSDSKKFPELMQVAASLRKPGDECASSVSELCNLCKAPVPFKSLEVAYCQRGERQGNGPNHKLQRLCRFRSLYLSMAEYVPAVLSVESSCKDYYRTFYWLPLRSSHCPQKVGSITLSMIQHALVTMDRVYW